MTLPEKYSELENAVRFALDADEELLWAERRSYTMDRDVWAVLAGGHEKHGKSGAPACK